MRAMYHVFLHFQQNAAYRERTWKNCKKLIPERKKCRRGVTYLPQKP